MYAVMNFESDRCQRCQKFWIECESSGKWKFSVRSKLNIHPEPIAMSVKPEKLT